MLMYEVHSFYEVYLDYKTIHHTSHTIAQVYVSSKIFMINRQLQVYLLARLKGKIGVYKQG